MLILVMVFRATCSIKVMVYRMKGVLLQCVCKFVIKYEPVNGCVVSVFKPAFLSIINTSELELVDLLGQTRT